MVSFAGKKHIQGNGEISFQIYYDARNGLKFEIHFSIDDLLHRSLLKPEGPWGFEATNNLISARKTEKGQGQTSGDRRNDWDK